MPGMFEVPTGQPAKPVPKWGVGARGRSLMNFDPNLLAKFLGYRNEQRQEQNAFSADQSRFDSALALSGMSERDKQLARLFRQSPDVGRAMMQGEARDEAREHQRAMQEDRQRQQEAILKEKQDAADAVEREKKQLAADNLAEAKASGVKTTLPVPFAPAGSTINKQPLKFSIPGFGGMGGFNGGQDVDMEVPVSAEVNVMPARAYALIAKEDPTSPALKGAMTSEKFMVQRQAADKAQSKYQEGFRKRREAEARERAKEEERSKKVENDKLVFAQLLGEKEPSPEQVKMIEGGSDPYKVYDTFHGKGAAAKVEMVRKIEAEAFKAYKEYEALEAKLSAVTDEKFKDTDGKEKTRQKLKLAEGTGERDAMIRLKEAAKARYEKISDAALEMGGGDDISKMSEEEMEAELKALNARYRDQGPMNKANRPRPARFNSYLSALDANGTVDGNDFGTLAGEEFGGVA